MVIPFALQIRDGTLAVLVEVYEIVLPIPLEPFLVYPHAQDPLTSVVLSEEKERFF